MTLTWRRNRFECVLEVFDERRLAREARFQWDEARRLWFSTDPGAANALAEYADFAATEKLREFGLGDAKSLLDIHRPICDSGPSPKE